MTDNCLFCKIVKGEIPAEVVYQDQEVLAFKDISPQAPYHLLIIPKTHYTNILDFDKQKLKQIFEVIAKLTEKYDLQEKGFRIVNNCGQQGGQTVDHLHFHLLGGRQLQWPPG